MQAAVTASVMGLSSRVATLLVVNKGNLGAVQRELFSSTTVIDLTKTIAASVLTAGIATSVGASPTLNATQEAFKTSTSFTQSLQTLSGYMMCSSAAHFVVDSVESTINRKINGNILVKGFVNSVQSSAVETVASAVCHQIGKSYPQMERTLIDEINHKLLHGVTAAGASVLMGNPDGALASAGAAMVAETVVDGLDAINRQTQQNMTHQERQAIQQMEAKKALDQKTNKSIFNFTIRNRDIASLVTAFMLAFTTPDHLVAEAYQASQRALDWNHDVSSIKEQMKEIEEEREEPRLVFEDEDGYESDTSYKLRKAVLKREKSLSSKRDRGEPISIIEQFELDSLTETYEERATRSAEVKAWKRTHQWVQEHPKRAAALAGGAAVMVATAPVSAAAASAYSLGAVGTGLVGAGISAAGSAVMEYGFCDESVPTTEKAINMGKAATLGAIPFLKYPYMMMASGTLALYGYAADDSMMKWGGGLTFAGGVLVKGVQTLVKGSSVVPSASVSKGVESLGLEVPKVKILERPADSKYYSVAFKAKLQEGIHFPGVSDRIHFQECNRQLYMAMKTDVGLTAQLEASYPGLLNAVSPGPRGGFPVTSPLDLTWHHNTYEKGLMELVPAIHHEASGVIQNNLHPGGKGGMHAWGGGRKKK